MEERVVRNDEVRGSIPLGSTRMKKAGCHAGLFRGRKSTPDRQARLAVFTKENGRRPSKRKAFRLAVSGLNDLCASGMRLPARGVAALALLYDLPLLLSSAVAQPLAALTPYGCGTPLAGAALPIL